MASRILAVMLSAGVVALLTLPYLTPANDDPPNGLSPTIPSGSPQTPALPAPFSHWPVNVKPDAVLVLTGQTWGYLRPCGCSQKQLGGLERRANLIGEMKAKGWPVAAVDLGDVAATTGQPNQPPIIPDQAELKYVTAMTAMKEMGYLAVGLGKYEFSHRLHQLLAKYSLQPGNEQPRVLAANLSIKTEQNALMPRSEAFPPATPGGEPYVGDAMVAKVGTVNVGVASVIGSSLYEEIAAIDKSFGFFDNAAVIPETLKKLNAGASKLRVLLFQGTFEHAQRAAAAYPQFDVILCQSSDADALPPSMPNKANNGKTLIVQVGHKGQYCGVVGAFTQADGSLKLEYQLIELTEQYLTPKDAAKEAKHPILKLLQKYADEVQEKDFLKDAAAKKQLHGAQIRYTGGKLTFVGSDACKTCHFKEHEIWAKSKHGEALKFLEDPKYSNRPTGRQYDPECVICHTVGFSFQSGYEAKDKTPKLQHVGCEVCHGPGSGHAANPANKELLTYLSPWKTKPGDLLPGKDVLEAIGKADKFKDDRGQLIGKLTVDQRIVINAVVNQCVKCHDPENDPKFDLYEYMPKIWHSGFKTNPGAGLPMGIGK